MRCYCTINGIAGITQTSTIFYFSEHSKIQLFCFDRTGRLRCPAIRLSPLPVYRYMSTGRKTGYYEEHTTHAFRIFFKGPVVRRAHARRGP